MARTERYKLVLTGTPLHIRWDLLLRPRPGGAFAAAVSAEKLRAQINGLLAPVEVKTMVEAASSPPVREPSLAEALEELEAIEEILRAARPGLAARRSYSRAPDTATSSNTPTSGAA